MSNATFNWGIIGCGHIANKFATDINKLPNAQIYACASRSKERGTSFAKKHAIKIAFDSYEALAKCAEVDAVYIATRHIFHKEHTLLCLNNLMPVLCEKPFAMNIKQVKEMINCAHKHDTYLMEALWTRFLPQTNKVLELIKTGTIGEVQSVKADFGFEAKKDINGRLFNRDLGGGAILDIGIYPIFLALLILGVPDKIEATAQIGATHVDEANTINFHYADHKKAALHSTILKQTPTEAYIYGSKGHIHIHNRWHEPSSLSVQIKDKKVEKIDYKISTFGYNYEAVAVMDDLKNNKKENKLMSHDFSLNLITILDEVRKQVGMIYPKFD